MPWRVNRQSNSPTAHVDNFNPHVIANYDCLIYAPTQNQHNINASCKRSCALQVNLMPRFSGGQCGEYESKVYPDKVRDRCKYVLKSCSESSCFGVRANLDSFTLHIICAASQPGMTGMSSRWKACLSCAVQ
jgi:hypothetical protein